MARHDEGEVAVNLSFAENATRRPLASFFFNLTGNETIRKRAELWVERPVWMDLALNATGESRGNAYRMDLPRMPATSPTPPSWGDGEFLRVHVLVTGDGVESWGYASCPLLEESCEDDQAFAARWNGST